MRRDAVGSLLLTRKPVEVTIVALAEKTALVTGAVVTRKPAYAVVAA